MISWSEVLLRLLMASVLGASIGLERERKDLVAGVRTHMMVCLGSTLVMLVSMYGFESVVGAEGTRLDPARVAAQVVSGIGFIGAGTILFLRDKIVRGLTTAAGLWTVAAIGLAVGGGMYFAAIITTVFALTILWGIQYIEAKFFPRPRHEFLKIVVESKADSSKIASNLFEEKAFIIESFSVDIDKDGNHEISMRTRGVEKQKVSKLVADLQKDFNIKRISWDS